MKIGIIGAGIAGLAAAVRLASRGHEVHIFEANAYAGGKLSEFELTVSDSSNTSGSKTYRFDAGPSLFTMPMYVEELFAAANDTIEPHFSYEKLDIVCQYFWEDGTRLTAWADEKKLAEEIENQLDIQVSTVQKIFKSAAHKYRWAGTLFLENSLHRVSTWLNWRIVKSILRIPTFDIFKTMNRTHEQLAEGNPKLVQFLNRFATYNGSNPYRASGMLSMIPHFEHGIGAFYPKGGMIAITRAIEDLAKRQGVKCHFQSKVSDIIVEKRRAIGLKIQKTTAAESINPSETILFDRIVSNMDVYFTYKKLMPREKQPKKILQQERSTSGLIFYWGINRTFPELDLHNIFFSKDYKKEFDALQMGTICDDPTVYINISSKKTPTDAPDQCENWFVLINAPFNSGQQNWDSLIAETRIAVVNKISRILGIDFQKCIEAEAILDPLSIEAKTASFAGSLYGTSSNSMTSAFMRHPNFSARIKNLYFVGGSVHPGGGIPLALLSAKILDDLIQN
jgi:phytoene desaturase